MDVEDEEEEEDGQVAMIKVWPTKEGVHRLQSHLACTRNGHAMRKGGLFAQLESAADQEKSCMVPKNVWKHGH